YIVDTYRGKAVQPETLLDFLLFIAFFPQLGAGPICRSQQLLPQLHRPSPPGIPHLSEAFALIVTGLFKKMVLGTYLASHLTTNAFLAPSSFSSLELVLAVYAYTAQVYLDFSGYTDIARGVGLLFGFDLPENFNYPYAATNIGDFWRRWHITFSTWLREYIYFPLGGSRAGRMRTYVNPMITFTACGIWHGATWGYVIWGALHGVGLSVYKASLDIRRDYGIDTDSPKAWYWNFGGWFATISFCAFARIFFKAPDLDTAWTFWGQLFDLSWQGAGFDIGVALIFALTIFMNFYGRACFDLLVRLHDATPRVVRPLAWASAMLALMTLKPYGMAATIYFQF
ncbi:MAG: MBOAT family O-acyltransferase, partial [Myxococcota bacterium]